MTTTSSSSSSRVRLPEEAERVAISLGDPTNGPFLIVTRDGRFVTCLGEGMKVDDIPIITRGQLDTIAERHDELRSRLVLCEQPEGATARRRTSCAASRRRATSSHAKSSGASRRCSRCCKSS